MLKKFPQTKFLCVGALVWASHVHILALAVQRWPRKKKNKVARNFLKFCMEVYNPILSTSGKDVEKIPKKEVFLVGCFGVGNPRENFGLGGETLAWEKKKKVARNFLKF